MNDNTLERVGNAFLATMLGGLMVATVFGVVMMFLSLFCSGPTGEYYVAAQPSGYISEVKERVRFDTDTILYTGPNREAWIIYDFLENGPSAPKSKVDPGKMTLRMM